MSNFDATITQTQQCLNKICDIAFEMWYKWRGSLTEKMSESADIAQCILQMMIAKGRSINKLSEGIHIGAVPDGKKINVPDSITIYSVYRAMFEQLFVFKNIFIMPRYEEEHMILLRIWQICGLNNRTKEYYVSSDTSKETINKTKEKIRRERDLIEKKVEEIGGYIQSLEGKGVKITDQGKKIIRDAVKSNMYSGFHFKHDAFGNIKSFKNIKFKEAGQYIFSKKQFQSLYPHLSSKAHPSFLGLLQFGQLYGSEAEISFLREPLTAACIYLSLSIQYFIQFVPSSKKYLPSDANVFDILIKMATLYDYCCPKCSYRVKSHPLGHFPLIKGETYQFACRKCREVVELSASEIGTLNYTLKCPKCETNESLSLWNPIEGRCPKCGANLKKEEDIAITVDS